MLPCACTCHVKYVTRVHVTRVDVHAHLLRANILCLCPCPAQMQALLCMRVLTLRIAPEHLGAVWPVVMAELQRLLLFPHATRPALLLSVCQLIDILLTVLPEDFAPFGWMFIPQVPSTLATNVDHNEISHDDHYERSQHSREISGDACYIMSPTHTSEFTALLQPLCALGARAEGPHEFHGLLQPSADGRRRPLLGMRAVHHVSELAPFASRLRSHLKTSVLLPRSAEARMRPTAR